MDGRRKYGIFVHWSSQSRGFAIAEKRAEWFQKSVEMFDVNVFADAIERTGAAWITFTATHQGFYWPAPNAAIDKIAPGRTAERDLLGEIINELDKRGIRTLFYLHTGYNGYDPEVWREALGAKDADTKRFSDNIEAILRECSLRYGDKLMGFGYMDGALGVGLSPRAILGRLGPRDQGRQSQGRGRTQFEPGSDGQPVQRIGRHRWWQ